MAIVKWKLEAKVKLKEIFAYISKDGDKEGAIKVVNGIKRRADFLKDFPRMAEFIEPPFRSLTCVKEQYHILYVFDEGIDTVSIFFVVKTNEDTQKYRLIQEGNLYLQKSFRSLSDV